LTDDERDAVLRSVDQRLGDLAQRQMKLEEVLTGKVDGLEVHLTVKVGELSSLINRRYVDALVRAAGTVARRNEPKGERT